MLVGLPSSNVTLLKLLLAAATWIFLPVPTLAVKLIFKYKSEINSKPLEKVSNALLTFLTRMWLASRSPVLPSPVRTCTTPGGNPARSNNGAIAKDPSGLFFRWLHYEDVSSS